MANGIIVDGFPRTTTQARFFTYLGEKQHNQPTETMNLVLMGPPGAGKGTQASKIEERYGIPHKSSGSALRSMKNQELPPTGETPAEYIDEGRTIPDAMMLPIAENMVYETVGEDQDLERVDINREIVDYIENEMDPAEVATEDDFVDLVVYLDVNEDNIFERITKRRECEDCGTNYHLKFNPPEEDMTCNECDGDLYQRKDDKPEPLQTRLEIFEKDTKPVKKYYEEKGLIRVVDGNPSIEEVKNDIFEILDKEFPSFVPEDGS